MLRNFKKAVAWSLWHHMMGDMPTISPVNRFKRVFMVELAEIRLYHRTDWYQVAVKICSYLGGNRLCSLQYGDQWWELYAQTVKEALDKRAEKGPVKK